MNKKIFVPFLAVALAIAVLLVIASMPGSKGFVVEETLIDSGELDVFNAFQNLENKDVFIVSPQVNEVTKQVDHAMLNGTNLFVQVLTGNNKTAIQLYRVYNEDKELVYCFTNYGDVNKSERLEKQACLEYLSPKNGALILLDFPDQSLAMPVLEIDESQLIVKSNKESEIGEASFLALRIMFKNSKEIVEKSNLILKNL